MEQLTDAEAFPLAKRTRNEMLRHCYFLLFHAVIVRTVRERVSIAKGATDRGSKVAAAIWVMSSFGCIFYADPAPLILH